MQEGSLTPVKPSNEQLPHLLLQSLVVQRGCSWRQASLEPLMLHHLLYAETLPGVLHRNPHEGQRHSHTL